MHPSWIIVHNCATHTCIIKYGETPKKPCKTQRSCIFFLRTERKVRIALRAIRNQSALDWTADDIIGKNNKYTVRKCFYLENKYPAEFQQNSHAKSMAFSSNTLFNATSVKLRLRALSMQKGICDSWVGQIQERVKNTKQVWRPYLRK